MRFYVQRTVRAIFSIWMAMTLTFALVRLMPGNPVDKIEGEMQTRYPERDPGWIREQVAARVENLNLKLDAPLHEQYIHYMTEFVTGNFGKSLSPRHQGEAVGKLIGEWLPWTLLVTLTATILIFIIAIGWGAIIAYKEGSRLDSVSSSVGIFFAAFPSYVVGFGLILFVGYELGWLPTSGRMPGGFDIEQKNKWILDNAPRGLDFYVAAFRHAALPIASLVITKAGLQMLAMRGNSIQVLGNDYVRVARLRGLADRRIATRYVARNAILPLYTSFLTLIGFNLGASVIIEEVFVYKGMGYWMLRALENLDYPVMMGTFFVYTVALVLAVFVADLTYSKIDPRVQTGESSEAY